MSEQTTETPKVGRPTKYNDSYVKKVDEYIKKTIELHRLPTIEGYSLYVNIDDETVSEWSKIHPEFSATINRLKKFQKAQLINDGLYDKNTNSLMAMFLLKCNHGMIETQHIDHTTKGKEMPQPILGGSGNVPIDNGSE